MESLKKESFKFFTFFAVLFVAVLLISNVAAQKLIPVGPFIFTAGILVFPISYIFGDVLTEVYGYKNTRKIIWLGFLSSTFMAIFFWIIIKLPAAPGWNNQAAFETTLMQVPRVVFASLVAYLFGEFSNSYVISKLKIANQWNNMCLRFIASTLVGQFFDTIIFAVIAFGGIIPNDILITAIWSGYLFKVVYETIVSPLTVIIVNYIKKKEGVDVYDNNVNYNPLSL
ncbi:MAG: queuosine precursor transporter [Chitinophagales bacterium]